MKNKAWIYFSTSSTTIICLIFGAISGIIAARLLGSVGRGELAIISYFPSLISSIFCLSVPQALIFFVTNTQQRQCEIMRAGVRMSLILGVLGAVTFAMLAPYFINQDNQKLAFAITAVCLASPAMVVTPHLNALNWGLKRFGWCNGLKIFSAIGYVALLLSLWMIGGLTPFGAALSALGLQTLLSLLHLWRLGFSNLLGRIEWSTYRMLLLQGVKFFIPVLAGTLFIMSDRAILLSTTTMKEIGYYAVAFALSYPLSLAVDAFANIGFVEIASADDDRTSIGLTVRRFQMAQVIIVISVLVMIPLVYPIIRFGFGAEFLPAITVSYFMVPAMSLRGLFNVLDFNLRARDFNSPGTIGNFVALGCLIGLGAWLVPEKGVESFGFALLSAQTAGLIVPVFFMHRILSVKFRDFWGLRPSIFVSLFRNLSKIIPLRTS